MAKKQCYKCKDKYDTKDMTHVLTHWICANCYDNYITSDEYYKEQFIDNVWKLYTEKPVHQQLVAQVNELHTQYGFKYQGMIKALEYYLKENKWNESYLLYQAFPKAYYDAIHIYTRQAALQYSMPDKLTNDTKTVETRNVSYKPPLPL